MYKLIPLFIVAVHAAPTLVIDYNCTPNIACAVMTSALANKGIGLVGINDIEITSTNPMRRSSDIKYACPVKYCQTLKDPAPTSHTSCFEYPFSSTVKERSSYKCVPRDELATYQAALESFYSSNSVGDGKDFYVRVTGISDTSCLNFYV
jgi:hypothetical protein